MISTPYHTDDFYQRMLDLGERANRMNSGTCHGGPLDGKMLHHPAPAYQVAIDQGSFKTIPGMISNAEALSALVKFGTYSFADGVWTWQE